MDGELLEIVKRLVIDFGDSFLVILFGSLVLVVLLFMLCWFITRRRYGKVEHQVPGGVVKDYLDSVIQNSTALRSALFREAGLDRNSPSVIPVYKLDKENKTSTLKARKEKEEQKEVEITTLKEQLAQKDQTIGNLQNQVSETSQRLNNEIEQLKQQLTTGREVSEQQDIDVKEELPEVPKKEPEIQMASSATPSPKKQGEEKTAEDLLDEFEKMLG